MGYMHIVNLYRPEIQVILREEKVYALEKVHGTSAHISYKYDRTPEVMFSSGGEKHANFVNIFDEVAINETIRDLGLHDVVVFGEAYGGKQQGMSKTYGPVLRFIVFDVKVGDVWLTVPEAELMATKLGLEFVPYELVDCNLDALDRERDRPSVVAERRGTGEQKREGIVIRPLTEKLTEHGERLMAKHKGADFQERQNQPKPSVDPQKYAVLAAATAIADEWVTSVRLEHVLDKLPEATGMEHTGLVIKAMVEDVYREAKGEIVESKEAAAAIGKKTAQLYKRHVQEIPR